MKIIAESAFNHNGNLAYLKELALASKNANTDYFTVQVMNPDAFCIKEYSKYNIYKENSFTEKEWLELFAYCKQIELNVIPCVLDEPSFDLCLREGFTFLKIHATDILNEPLLKKVAKHSELRVILETQCATYQDISFALSIIGKQVDCLMHGFSNYPTEVEDLRLNSIDALKIDFPGYKLGFADHSLDITEIPLMTLAKGVDYLEKHFTITRNNRNFDWQASLYPHQFAAMVANIQHYQKALGKTVKHPVKNELAYRDVMYKKVTPDNKLLRMDNGNDFLTHKIKSFSNKKVGIALIARLKSQRLKKKVLKPFHTDSLIEDLYNRLNTCARIDDIYLATSPLNEDKPLADLLQKNNKKVFLGHPVSVLDRMLSLAIANEWGGVFRVTGDNPFTDPVLIDEMVKLFVENNLDYVRVNNVPFGISGELFSVSYLWELYKQMDNPLNSEYLSWFVIKDDNAKKGCINIKVEDDRLSLVNLSIDYPQDYDRAIALLNRIDKDKFNDIQLKEIVKNADLNDIEDPNKTIKLPEGESILFKEYLQLLNNVDYFIKKEIVL